MGNSQQHKIFTKMEDDIHNAEIDEKTKNDLLRNLLNLKKRKLNIIVTGATGSGKSSTINAMFKMEVAKVGVGVDPETMEITKHELGNMILWDSPGLGDGKEKDNLHSKAIIKKLNEIDENNEPLIDLVLVILDGSTRDLGTSYELINSVIIPNIGADADKRLLVAVNQADMAMKGRDAWDYKDNKPTPKAKKFLDDKVTSIKGRIKEATGIEIDPVYFCAGYKEKGEEQRPYNLSKLLYLIVKNTPQKKRTIFIDNISSDDEMWADNDDNKNYNEEIKQTLWESVTSLAGEVASSGADIGSNIGEGLGEIVFGKAGGKAGKAVGEVIGTVVGGAIGAVGGFIGGLFK